MSDKKVERAKKDVGVAMASVKDAAAVTTEELKASTMETAGKMQKVAGEKMDQARVVAGEVKAATIQAVVDQQKSAAGMLEKSKK
ncbi:hypothetical protein BV898_14356 [Hypsibius exemplaris]|uniref:Uncharacterized protein n=1 Tax=Hypsibius exemplaris TaxID=2072580 RepID=A0A9X6RJC6_HYPEX|nr:hypothetical protein BV898_14356 [Hypsibius exemplaris]